MKNYTITVNGNVYDVTVEETGAGAAPTPGCSTESSSKSSSKGSTESGSRSSRIY